MKDKGWLSSRGVHFGGSANNGANAGFVYANSNNAPSNSNANIGSRHYFFKDKNIKGQRPCHLAKKVNIKTELVEMSVVWTIESPK